MTVREASFRFVKMVQLFYLGVLYDALNQPEDAIADFEAILKLRKDVAVAHLNLGLIYLTKMESFQKYVRMIENVLTLSHDIKRPDSLLRKCNVSQSFRFCPFLSCFVSPFC